jgi:hypothetical protein
MIPPWPKGHILKSRHLEGCKEKPNHLNRKRSLAAILLMLNCLVTNFSQSLCLGLSALSVCFSVTCNQLGFFLKIIRLLSVWSKSLWFGVCSFAPEWIFRMFGNCYQENRRGANTVTLKQQRSIWEDDQEVVKRSGRDESIPCAWKQC